MNYRVLYRKYRPDNFENIVGQDYIIQTLKNSIISENISHAYIFSGPRGTGKTSTAKVFSKAINCLKPVDGSPCGKCEFCLNFVENPDIIEIDAASNNGVDEIRNLIDNVKLSPSNGKYKVYIIDEVHMLTTSAFNALLLTLEEPPAHIVFILATTNIENVPITILSRCQRFDFQKINPSEIVKRLKDICKTEKISIDDDALNEIAYLSDGGLRDALSLLDQLSKNGKKITLSLVENQAKIVSKHNLEQLLKYIEANDYEKLLSHINDYRSKSVDYKNLIKHMVEIISNQAKLLKRGRIKSRLSFTDYKNLILELSDTIVKVNVNVDPYIMLEMILMDYLDSEKESKNKEIDNSKIDVKKEDSSKKVEKIDDNIINTRINNCFVGASKKELEIVKEYQKEFIDSTKINGKIKSIIADSTVVAASDSYVILSSLTDHSATEANNYLLDIEKSFNQKNNTKYKLIFISNDRWNKEKQNYIDNIKQNKKYVMIEEKLKLDTEPIISDVFNVDKVEIV